MRLSDDTAGGTLLVRAYTPGELRVGDAVIRSSCLLRADRLITQWRPQTLSEITVEDLQPILALEPEIVVLGSGSKQRFPATHLLSELLARGIGCEVMDTGAACRTYNVLAGEHRRVVAALLLRDE
jgi:uncharacterized protein